MKKRVLRPDHVAELRARATKAAADAKRDGGIRIRHSSLRKIENAARTFQQRVWALDGKHAPLSQALGPFFLELAYQTYLVRCEPGRPQAGEDAATRVLFSGGMTAKEIAFALRELKIEGAGDVLERVKARIRRLREEWRRRRQGD